MARAFWAKIRKGSLEPTAPLLWRIHQTLANHHSRDPLFLKQIALKANSLSRMDFMEWTCKRCYESNLKDANYCQRCGEFWENTYYNYGNAGKQQWPAPPQNGTGRAI